MTPAIYPRISYQLSTVNFRPTVLACVLCILLLLQQIHDTLAYSYSRNYVHPQTLGRTCQQVCFLNKIQCKMQLVTIFGFGKATTGRKWLAHFITMDAKVSVDLGRDECYATFYISMAFPQMLQIAQNAWTSLVTHGHWSGKVWMQSRLESLK